MRKKYVMEHDYYGRLNRVLKCEVCGDASIGQCRKCAKALCRKHAKFGVFEGDFYCKACFG